MKKVAVLIFLAMLAGFGIPGHGFSQAHFYQGKIINVVYGGGPGGTVDLRFRATAAILRKHIPGSPTFVIEYMPGGGSRKAGNYIQGPAGRADHGRYALELCARGNARLLARLGSDHGVASLPLTLVIRSRHFPGITTAKSVLAKLGIDSTTLTTGSQMANHRFQISFTHHGSSAEIRPPC